MKYIIHRTLGPILFPSNIDHPAMAGYLGGADKIVSAGHYHCFPEFGKSGMGSGTLRLPENTKDAEIIDRHLKP